MGRLDEKVAIVVGAGQFPGQGVGNGRAMAILFAREGAKVMAVDKDPRSAEETRAIIQDEGGICSTLTADITSEAQCKQIAIATMQQHGQIDVLVNNVGTSFGDKPVDQLSEESWDQFFAINLKGIFFTCKYVIPEMAKRKTGSIINISSVGAVGVSHGVASKVSKAGVHSITHQMAMAHASEGIRVNNVMPGMMKTPRGITGIAMLTGRDPEELVKERDQAIPLRGGMGDAWDIANAALFFASNESKFITAATLPVDGGQSSRIG